MEGLKFTIKWVGALIAEVSNDGDGDDFAFNYVQIHSKFNQSAFESITFSIIPQSPQSEFPFIEQKDFMVEPEIIDNSALHYLYDKYENGSDLPRHDVLAVFTRL